MLRKVFVGLLAAVVCVVCADRCSAPQPVKDPPKVIELKTDEAAKVIIAPSKVLRAERKADGSIKTTKQYVPPEGTVTVTVKKDGAVDVRAKTRGLCFRPGVGGAVVGAKLEPVLDVKLLYMGRLGAVVGTGLFRLCPYGGISWQVWRNTALFGAVNLKKEYVAGLRVSL